MSVVAASRSRTYPCATAKAKAARGRRVVRQTYNDIAKNDKASLRNAPPTMLGAGGFNCPSAGLPMTKCYLQKY